MVRGICISGDSASGKSTAARLVVEALPGWSRVSTGDRFRAFCAARGFAPEDIPFLPDEMHRQLDEEMRAFLRTHTQFVADGRLVCWLASDMPDVLRVRCECPLEVRAERGALRDGRTLAEQRAAIEQRDRDDAAKFRHLYNVDYHDPALYDLVIDTAQNPPEAVRDLILRAAGVDF